MQHWWTMQIRGMFDTVEVEVWGSVADGTITLISGQIDADGDGVGLLAAWDRWMWIPDDDAVPTTVRRLDDGRTSLTVPNVRPVWEWLGDLCDIGRARVTWTNEPLYDAYAEVDADRMIEEGRV